MKWYELTGKELKKKKSEKLTMSDLYRVFHLTESSDLFDWQIHFQHISSRRNQ